METVWSLQLLSLRSPQKSNTNLFSVKRTGQNSESRWFDITLYSAKCEHITGRQLQLNILFNDDTLHITRNKKFVAIYFFTFFKAVQLHLVITNALTILPDEQGQSKNFDECKEIYCEGPFNTSNSFKSCTTNCWFRYRICKNSKSEQLWESYDYLFQTDTNWMDSRILDNIAYQVICKANVR